RRQSPGLLPGFAAGDPPIAFDDQGARWILAGAGTCDVGQRPVPPVAGGLVPLRRVARAPDEEAAHVPFEPPGHRPLAQRARGRPRSRSAVISRWISDVPPAIVNTQLQRYS